MNPEPFLLMKTVKLIIGWQVSQLVRGVIDFAREHQWHLVLHHDGDFKKAVDDWKGDGIIIAAYKNDVLLERYAKPDPPKLVSFTKRSDLTIPYTLVREDDQSIGKIAAEYFIGRGHTNFAYYSESSRAESFEQALLEHGRSICSSLSTAHPECLPEWLKSLPKPCAVFCENDWDASDVINTALWNRIPIPTQLAVLGVGNDPYVCRAPAVSISSIDSCLYKVGYRAAEEMDRLLNGEPPRREGIFIPPEPMPIERQSADFTASTDPKLQEILNYMKQNASKKITIHSIATHFYLSDSTLYKLFTAGIGRSPKRVLLEMRLRIACSCLLHGRDTMEEVAENSGFPTPGAFFAAFKEKFNQPPAQWRSNKPGNE